MTKLGVPAPDLLAPRLKVNSYPIDELRVLREAYAFESAQALAMYGEVMRTTDDPNPQPFNPLGEKVSRPPPAPKPQAPQGPSGIVTDEAGDMSTTRHPLPEGPKWYGVFP